MDRRSSAELVRGEARVARPGVVAVGEREIEYGNLVVATGSSPAVPPVEGIADVDYWTNREAVWTDAAPESIVLGGGPVGVELAQFFHRLGSHATIVEPSGHLLARIDSEAGELLRERFEEEGIDVRVGARAERVEAGDSGVRVVLSSGDRSRPSGSSLTGRRPNVDGLGLEQLDIELTKSGITVDERMRAGERVWAIGDPSGVALLTCREVPGPSRRGQHRRR